MNDELEENWNTIVLKVATSGGFLMEIGSDNILCITDIIIEPRSDQLMTVFRKFFISKCDYKKILNEALILKDELYMMNEDSKAKAAKKKAAARTKKRNTRNTKTAKK